VSDAGLNECGAWIFPPTVLVALLCYATDEMIKEPLPVKSLVRAAPSSPTRQRDGKFFRLGGKKDYVKGVFAMDLFAPTRRAAIRFARAKPREADLPKIHGTGAVTSGRFMMSTQMAAELAEGK